ncbi:ABC transporter permease [Methanothrix sp.]|jgi:peptide/nickel transport system permease protein|uniref:ABC transporter permease n=1 Tax=Methanothrix sp. TaxID=90426 RepID=UPI003BB5898B
MIGILLFRKFLRYIITFLAMIALIFFISHLMPGSPLKNILGEETYFRMLSQNPETLEELNKEYGLNRPLVEQFIIYLTALVNADLGYSYKYRQPISELILFRLKWTLLLLLPSTVLGAMLGAFFGALTGWNHRSGQDSIFTSWLLFVYSMPHYWLAMLFVLVFAFHLDLLPLSGICSAGSQGFQRLVDILVHMALPVSVLTSLNVSYNYLIMRGSVVQIMGEGFVLTARAKGLMERDVLFRHVLRNAMLPLVTVIALDFGFMVSGALLVEIVFSWGGMGTLVYDAVMARDYPLLHGSFLVIACCVLAANFIADVLYVVLDPRLRAGETT